MSDETESVESLVEEIEQVHNSSPESENNNTFNKGESNKPYKLLIAMTLFNLAISGFALYQNRNLSSLHSESTELAKTQQDYLEKQTNIIEKFSEREKEASSRRDDSESKYTDILTKLERNYGELERISNIDLQSSAANLNEALTSIKQIELLYKNEAMSVNLEKMRAETSLIIFNLLNEVKPKVSFSMSESYKNKTEDGLAYVQYEMTYENKGNYEYVIHKYDCYVSNKGEKYYIDRICGSNSVPPNSKIKIDFRVFESEIPNLEFDHISASAEMILPSESQELVMNIMQKSGVVLCGNIELPSCKKFFKTQRSTGITN